MATETNEITTSGLNELDLAFIIDATASMGSYIRSAQENMKHIIHDLVTSEKCLLNSALILYRDHPPQDSTFVTRVFDFTDDSEEAKKNIDSASASGGGDGPEAMAPALHDAVNQLKWRSTATKIAVLIADAPPHGLEKSGDHWPDGDPSGHDPVECTTLLAERSVTLYTIGCEPAATPYRDFFMALAFKTGGQYIPLNNSANLASVIIGSTKEDISLERLLAKVHEEVMQEAATRGGPVDEAELTRRIHEVMKDGGVRARRVKLTNPDGTDSIPELTTAAEELSKLSTLKEVREKWVRNTTSTFHFTTTLFGASAATSVKPMAARRAVLKKPKESKIKKKATAIKEKAIAVKRKATAEPKSIVKKKARVPATTGSRRSARLVFTANSVEEESTEEEPMETTSAAPKSATIDTPAPVTVPKPPTEPKSTKTVPKLKPTLSDVRLDEDELLDITQTRRMVRKCVARNKLKST